MRRSYVIHGRTQSEPIADRQIWLKRPTQRQKIDRALLHWEVEENNYKIVPFSIYTTLYWG